MADNRRWVVVVYSVATPTGRFVRSTFGRGKGSRGKARVAAQEYGAGARVMLLDDHGIKRIEGVR
jgi:hypothetical protein